jgi:DNA-binding LytR/AlgR family response regulator
MMIRCIAIDDEPLALDLIRDYTERIPFLSLEGLFESGMEVLDWLQHHQVDLIFLDIMMPDITGIQFMEILQNRPLVVFTTAYDQYALKGFELDVVDYLLKPISFDRFLKAVLKAQDRLFSEKPGSTNESATQGIISLHDKGYIFIRTEGHLKKIDLRSIGYIEGMKDYLSIHTGEGRIMTLMNFRDMLNLLPKERFIRIHRSFIIHVDCIDRVESKVVIIKNKRIPIGKAYRDGFFEMIKNKQNNSSQLTDD